MRERIGLAALTLVAVAAPQQPNARPAVRTQQREGGRRKRSRRVL